MDDPSITISVIVPAYNAGDTIERCLESILSQTYQAIEVIAIDDCSTDNTCEVLQELARKDDRVRIVSHSENRGVHAARASGVGAATGQYIGFVDSDDWIAPNMYRTMLSEMTAEAADIAICGASIVGAAGEIKSEFVRFAERRVWTEMLCAHLCARTYGSGVLWNKLYRAEIVRPSALLELERSVDGSEDYIVNIGAFANAHRVLTLPVQFYNYVERASSAAHRATNAHAFCRVMRAYAVALEKFAQTSAVSAGWIDLMYAKQLRMYRVSDPSEFLPYRDHLKESIVRLLDIRPAGLHAVVNEPHELLSELPEASNEMSSQQRVGMRQALRHVGASITELMRESVEKLRKWCRVV